MDRTPIVALVGRANVGKSSLLNRLSESYSAIVSKEPGTTRDIVQQKVIWKGRYFIIWDTAGIDIPPKDETLDMVLKNTRNAIKKSDFILFIVDGKVGVLPEDIKIAKSLKTAKKPVLVAVNKIDQPAERERTKEFLKFSLGVPIDVSAKNGRGIGNLLEKISETLKLRDALEDIYENSIKVAIIGKPNVGKSSVLNALLAQEKAIVSSIPHTTRDVVYDYLKFDGYSICLLDTAGIRRRSPEKGTRFLKREFIEKQAVKASFRALAQSKIVYLVVDALQGLTKQDEILAGNILDKEKSLIILANKIDLIPRQDWEMCKRVVHSAFDFAPWVEVILFSAKEKINVKKLLSATVGAWHERTKKVDPDALNRALKYALSKHKPPIFRGKPLRFVDIEQIGHNPPQFEIKVSPVAEVPQAYLRFLENRLREIFAFKSSPIKFKITKS